MSTLEYEARLFAGTVTDLLNGTVAHGVRLSAVLQPDRNSCAVARDITKRRLRPTAIPLTLGGRAPTAHLLVAYILEWDPEGAHLAVTKSEYALYAAPDLEGMVCHFDYERDPTHGYPEAHVQVSGSSDAFDAVRGSSSPTELKDLHFPVGGRRFRPSLEDVVEFLIVEGIAEGREGWGEVVADHRADWRQRQLAAAVRRAPGVAAAQLSEDGWTVRPPDAEEP